MQVRTVLVGCGGISRTWLDAIREIPEVEIVGAVDIVEEAARARAEEYGLSHAVIGTRLKDVLEATRPDAVFNCTIPEAHLPVTLEALEFGCHVLGEKPLADSMDNARRMVDAALKAGRIFAVIQNRRYDGNIRRLRAFVESGTLGPITTVDSDFYLGAHFGGFRDRMKHVLLLDMAIHTFDAARLITGADPLSVYCHEWNPSGSWYDHDASAIAIFEMSDGLVYSYRGSWCAEGLNTTWECDWRVIGERGSVRWDGAQGFCAEVVAQTGGFRSELAAVPVPEIDPGTKVGAHGGVIREFVHAVQTGTDPETVCTDNIKSLAMVFGAIESAETGRRVDIRI
ncbi:MAG: Gfo/Idh/MocA family protein [Anaerolineae bacterium]|jgi:predicted dehydrogenase